VTTPTKAPVIKGGVDAGEMQPRNQNHRHGLIATLPLAVLLAACGTGATPSSPSPSTPTPSPSSNSTTPTPTLVPTPSPTAVPTPAPEPPLAVFFGGPGSQQGGLEVVNGQGVEQWGLTNAQEGQLFGLTAKQASNYNLAPQMGGSNLFFFYQATPTSPNKVAVVSRTGKLLGIGTAPALPSPPYDPSYTWSFVVSPTGTEWAWPVDQTPNANGKHQGVVEIGGLGEANRILYRWVAPVGFTETLVGWTDTGIIMQRTEDEYCGGGNDTAADAWFAINPRTAKLTELFTGNERFLGASSADTVASLINDPHTVLINGVKYSESKSVLAGADISPDGAHVGVLRVSFNPCGGGTIPKDSIEIVNVANHTHVDLPNLQLQSWWGNNEIVAVSDTPADNPAPTTPVPDGYGSASEWIYTLQGEKVSQILPANTQWGYQGTLAPA
jgi:hypothetical protein